MPYMELRETIESRPNYKMFQKKKDQFKCFQETDLDEPFGGISGRCGFQALELEKKELYYSFWCHNVAY